jgi:pimeloyl-ACP methyl ester carboxylesterase
MTDLDRRTLIAAGAASAGAVLTLPAAARRRTNLTGSDAFEHLVTRHRTVQLNGLEIFYREAGRPDAPAVLLLHGFPASSHMFRHLIPALAEDFRVVAPDYPGFGYSSFPPREDFRYTFEALAEVIGGFTDRIGLNRFAIYVQDYGAPVGLRLTLKRPSAIAAVITQNGNAYVEGLSKLWDPLKTYWREPSPANRAVLQGWLGAEGTRLQYAAGVRDDQLERLTPDTWTLDWDKLSRPGNAEVQIDLFGDYQSNIELYPEFQRFFRDRQPPMLILWGKNDPFFTVEGAKAFLRDAPHAELELVDASHFVLETHGAFAAERINDFLKRSLR